MDKKSRTEYAIKNATVAMITQVITIVIQYICRIVFVRILTKDYVGLNGLFSNVLQMLSLAELGLSSAIAYSLYRPIATNDKELLKSIVNLFKKTFYVISLLIFFIGIIISFNLNIFINELPNIDNIQIIFLLYVSDISISYLGTYKSTLITAYQKAYICEKIELLFKVLLNIVQIVILLCTHSFILYVLIQIIVTIIKNIVYTRVANREYPILKEKNISKIDEGVKNEIIKNVKATFLHKLGYVIVEATDNILISKFVSLAIVASYSNYVLIRQSIVVVVNKLFNSLTASIGNLGVETDDNKKNEVFYRLMFCSFAIYCLLSVGIINVSSDFVNLCFGEDYLLQDYIVIMIAINFFIAGMRKPAETFLTALGLFSYNKFAPLVEGMINLVVSVLLAKLFGTVGIIIGTTISTFAVPFWIAPYVVMKKGINGNLRSYFTIYSNYFVVYLLDVGITYYVSKHIQFGVVPNIIGKGSISVIITALLIFMFYRNNKDFLYYIKLIKYKVRK